MKILENKFNNIKPVNPRYHDLLARIFLFVCIITTNCDTLIEGAYGFKCQVVRPIMVIF